MRKFSAMEVEVTTTQKIPLSLDIVAKWFAGLSDQSQADFFIAVANEGKSFDRHQGNQWFYVGRHLRDCECSTDEARQMIQTIAGGIEH
jgi:hypothetical protein